MTERRGRRARRRPRAGRSGVPPALVAPGLIGFAFLAVPTIGLLIYAPWGQLGEIYSHSDIDQALRVSLVSAFEALGLSLLFGVPLALLLARVRLPGIGVLRAVVTLPLVLPPIVGGVALLLTLGVNGFVGRRSVEWFDYQLSYTPLAVVLAETFVAMPFLVVTLEGAFRTADRGLEEAAATLGAHRLRIFTRVTLPAVLPSLVAGSVLCWARALGEFGATILFAGSVAGATQTMPTLIYYSFEDSLDNAVAVSLPLMAVAVIILVALRDRWLRRPAASV